jgi:hypothetical protein
MDYIIKIFAAMLIIVIGAYLVKENGYDWTKDLTKDLTKDRNEGFSATDYNYDNNAEYRNIRDVIDNNNFFKTSLDTDGQSSGKVGYATGNPIYQTYNFNADYQKDNNFVDYHDDFTNTLDAAGQVSGTAYIFDKDGKPRSLGPVPNALATPSVYYHPKDFVYGSLAYVPNYQDSVYLSRTSNMTIEKPVLRTNSVQGGVCNFYAKNPDRLETACNDIDEKVCASTSCCVLLGGAKCVSGNASGPTMKSNYSDTRIPNRDYYYYQSKCYGNCPNQ